MTRSLERSAARFFLPVVGCWLWSWPAVARESSELSFSASAQAFYGALPAASDSVNPYGPGLGVRAAVTLPLPIYLGASYEHFFGGDPSEWASIDSVGIEATTDQVSVWVGYSLALDGVTVTPRWGLGYAQVNLVTDDDGQLLRKFSEAGFILSPALELTFPVGVAELVLEGRYSFVPEELAQADALMIGVGFGASF